MRKVSVSVVDETAERNPMRDAMTTRYHSHRGAAPFWLTPAIWTVVAIVLAVVAPRIDATSPGQFNPELAVEQGTVVSILTAIASGMIAFTGFVFALVLLSVQFGTNSFSPRLIRYFQRDRIVRASLGAFIATFVYALLAAVTIGTQSGGLKGTPALTLAIAVLLMLISVVVFLLLVPRVVDLLRVVRLLRRVALAGAEAIDETHPVPVGAMRTSFGQEGPAHPDSEEEVRTVRNVKRSGVLLGVNVRKLVRLTTRADAEIELLPFIGDFVALGVPVLEVRGPESLDRKLRKCLVFGDERAVWQDPAFAFRVIADVAIKALSPAINDPTTAVQALDYIEDLLIRLAGRELGVSYATDKHGIVRATFYTPEWPDYVSLATDEIRRYGATSLQVNRRLRSLYLTVLQFCTAERAIPVRQRQELIEAQTAEAFGNDFDIELARFPDAQGLGGQAPAT